MIRDRTSELQQAVTRILKGLGVLPDGVYLLSKVPGQDLSTKINHVALELSPVDLVVVDSMMAYSSVYRSSAVPAPRLMCPILSFGTLFSGSTTWRAVMSRSLLPVLLPVKGVVG
jgi:hypothetical protein